MQLVISLKAGFIIQLIIVVLFMKTLCDIPHINHEHVFADGLRKCSESVNCVVSYNCVLGMGAASPQM